MGLVELSPKFAVPVLPNFFIFFRIFLDYKLSISYSPYHVAGGGTWNDKIIESFLSMAYSL